MTDKFLTTEPDWRADPLENTQIVRGYQPQTAPGHTDLMVSPESLDAWVDANPPPDEMINRNAVLEQAARECLVQMPPPVGDFEEGYRMACEENARNIRALKDETP